MADMADVYASPVLRRGYHVHPRKGACLVEFAGTLPGGPWTDHPPGIHPMLGALARAVNDATTGEARLALLPWAAWLVGTGDDETLGRTIATRAATTALRHADRFAAQRLAAALAHLTWDSPTGWWRATQQRHGAVRLVRGSVAIVAASARHPDETLRDLLAEGIGTARAHAGLPAVDVPAAGHRSWPATQSIEVEVRVPDGSESRYDHCTALPGRWPPELADAWTARRDELRRRTPFGSIKRTPLGG